MLNVRKFNADGKGGAVPFANSRPAHGSGSG